MTRSSPLHIDSFDLELVPMQPAHIDALHGLSASMSWPHRRADWLANLETGAGIVAVDEAERVHGCAMHFNYKNDISALGMVIAHPKLQRSGLFETLTKEILERAGGGRCFLNACKEHVASYRDLGIRTGRPVFQYQGYLPCEFSVARGLRPALPEDYAGIMQLDQELYGADRSGLIANLLHHSDSYVTEKNGRITGFAMRRPFGRGFLIGPVTAADETGAIALVTSLMAGLSGAFIRIDTRQEDGNFVQFLSALGFTSKAAVTTMTTGHEYPALGTRAFAISGHSTG